MEPQQAETFRADVGVAAHLETVNELALVVGHVEHQLPRDPFRVFHQGPTKLAVFTPCTRQDAHEPSAAVGDILQVLGGGQLAVGYIEEIRTTRQLA